MTALSQSAEIMALIPARGGSVGVPRKNVRLLGDKPLIAHTIEAALKAENISRVVVATDDDEIATVAKAFGADVPFKRPADISHGASHAFTAYRYAVDWLKENEEYRPDIVCVLLCTLPFRTAVHIDEAMARMLKHDHDWLFSINEFEQHPYRAMIKEGDRIKPFFDLDRSMMWANRQELPPMYRFNGAIIAARTEHIEAHEEYNIDAREFQDTNVGYVTLSGDEFFDIDTELDMEIAQGIEQQDR